MKHLKMFGLAVMAAAALMAVVGAGTASATALYNNGTKLAENAEISSTLSSTAKLGTTGGETLVTCTSGGVNGTISNAGGSGVDVVGNITSLTWGGCNHTTNTTANGSLSITYTEGMNGTVKGSGSKVTVSILGVSCEYGSNKTELGTATGTTEGEGNATIAINTVVEKVGGSFLCPSDATWQAEYEVTSPTPLSVASE